MKKVKKMTVSSTEFDGGGHLRAIGRMGRERERKEETDLIVINAGR